MFECKNGALQIMQVEPESGDLKLNIMTDIQLSYQKYIEETIYDDMEYMMEKLREQKGMEDYTLKVTVNPLQSYTFAKTQVKPGTSYYPVYGVFCRQGKEISNPKLLLRIPYMDDYGKINVNGKQKIVVNVLRSAEDISYNLKQGLFNIAMPYANIRILASTKKIQMKLGTASIDMVNLVVGMLYKAGDTTPIHEYLVNTVLTSALKLNPYMSAPFIYDDLEKRYNIFERFDSVQYRLGKTRDALNANLSLDRALGYILSRDVLNYKEGDTVTKDMISDFKRNRINCIYVQNHNMPEGYTYASENPIIITRIPAGTNNCKLLRDKFPEYADKAKIPVDLQLSAEEAIIVSNAELLSMDVVELLINNGFKELTVVAGKYTASAKRIKFSFEREIVGNYTARLRDLLKPSEIPDGRRADDWVYYYNNPNLEPVNDSNLTAHDMLAVLSTIGQILLFGKSTLLDRDTSFLKKVLMINEIFSETLRSVMESYIKSYGPSIQKNIPASSTTNSFAGLTTKWIKELNEKRFLATPDTINIASEVSQVNHITTEVSSSAEVKDEQRHLAIPFFGRLCPFETPAGKKLGIVNTKAIGARVRDGLIYTPYRKVLGGKDGIRISSKITWMSVKDELGNKFGDLLSLKKDTNGNYLNLPILARIPNPNSSDEPFMFRNINAFELSGGYVAAFPEQFIAPTIRLVPWACSNDATRLSYGSSQIRQAIYCFNSERPFVRTPMYEDIFTYSDTKQYFSRYNGTCISIDSTQAVIRTESGNDITMHLRSDEHIGNEDVTLELKVKSGDKVVKDQVIAEAHKYPQPFVIRAPYDCTIESIRDDAIQISKNGNTNGFVNLDDNDIVKLSNCRIMGQSVVFLNIKVSVGDRVKKGDILADTCVSRGGVYSPARNPLVAYIINGYNYEDGVCMSKKASIDYTAMIEHHIDVVISKKNYTGLSAKPISTGFKYCGNGDKVGSITCKKSALKADAINKSIRATLKANGIPFEIETLDDDKDSRRYRYHLVGFSRTVEGDKMAGRDGNKGVVSKVLQDSEGYQLMNGLVVDITLNPCGVPSRMNMGQMYDLHVGLCAKVLNYEIITDAYNCASIDEVKYLMRYVWTLANTDSIGNNITKTYNRAVFDTVCSMFNKIPKELHEHAWNNISGIIDWRGVFDVQGNASIYDPITGTILDEKATIGYPYYFKLMQIADEKANVRSGPLEESYSYTTAQPQKSEDSAKGQRLAEMELVALVALGAAGVIDEVINEKSDNIGRRVNNHIKQLGLKESLPDYCCTSRAVEDLLYLLEGCGVKLEVPGNVAKTDYRTSIEKSSYDLKQLVYEELSTNDSYGFSNTEASDYDDIED